MPNLDGFQTTNIIRKIFYDNFVPQSMIVAVSGITDSVNKNKAFTSGMNKCLYKPVNWTELDKIVKFLKFPIRSLS